MHLCFTVYEVEKTAFLFSTNTSPASRPAVDVAVFRENGKWFLRRRRWERKLYRKYRAVKTGFKAHKLIAFLDWESTLREDDAPQFCLGKIYKNRTESPVECGDSPLAVSQGRAPQIAGMARNRRDRKGNTHRRRHRGHKGNGKATPHRVLASDAFAARGFFQQLTKVSAFEDRDRGNGDRVDVPVPSKEKLLSIR